MTSDTYDHVIVGAGSAGAVLANRLSADGRHRVVLVEAGGPDRNPWIHVPGGLWFILSDPRHLWHYKSRPAEAFGGRSTMMLQGKGLGGSSSINGMLYMRGQREDYDDWAALGCDGWGWDDVLPYFRRSECLERGGSDDHHGRSGELKLDWVHERHPSSEAFLAAATAWGLPFNPDVNSGMQDGIGHLLATIHNGRRQSTARAFLRPAMKRPNLRVLTGSQVLRVTFEGTRATGIILRGPDGTERALTATKEVILAAGAFGSPAILQRSGIGPAEHLRDLGITPLVDAPEVGENLQDHLFAHLKYRTTSDRHSHNRLLRSTPRMGVEALKWLLTGRGALAMPTSQVTGFFRSVPGVDRADLQLSMRPFSFHVLPKGLAIDDLPAITVSAIQTRPFSRGRYRIASTDAADLGSLDMNHLGDSRDVSVLAAGMAQIRQMVAQPAMQGIIAEELEPGPQAQEAEDLAAYLRARASTVYHPVGTCRMGADPGAVVDPQLRVLGVSGLRVADASIMPRITSGNTNAPVIMIGEKAADLILN